MSTKVYLPNACAVNVYWEPDEREPCEICDESTNGIFSIDVGINRTIDATLEIRESLFVRFICKFCWEEDYGAPYPISAPETIDMEAEQ
jgi:hypothetical protein